MTGTPQSSDGAILDVAIIGAGISGIGFAAKLARDLPHKRFALLERRPRLGGTWDLFRYPGIRSDSDMYTLGFSFAPWRSNSAIGAGAAIRSYLEAVARDFGIAPHIRTDTHVTNANWNPAGQHWELAVAGGAPIRARFLYSGAGYYDHDQPHDPAIPGLDSFAGQVIHPQFWPESTNLSGKRVVVIGSGATAVSLIPALAKAGAQVTMLQRTPTWYLILPSQDRMARIARRLLPASWAHRLIRARNTRMQAMLVARSRGNPAKVAAWLTAQTKAALGDAWNETDFVPPYKPWEQRLCLVPDGDMLTTIRDGKANVATGRIASAEPTGLRLANGRFIEADAIVTATGLTLAPLGGIKVSLDGTPVNFADHWWYRDCLFSGLPNFAALFGYLNAGWTLRVEIVADYLVRLLRQMDTWRAAVVTPVLPAGQEPEPADLFAGFSSGYLQRGAHLLPRNAAEGPWRLEMNHFADKAALATAPFDDQWLRYDRALAEPAQAT
ncbi:MAG: NAD(P)/FAD-dependent oxidoreductase [Sphingomonadales bacterium]|nr:NAD(P)/FAD-dependent oxidoreductase [Sphingomonadales bacterium]